MLRQSDSSKHTSADNLPYEKVGKNEPVCIADEVPFEIPESWEWVRLGSIGDWGSGATPSRSIPEYYGGGIPWLKTSDLNDGYIEYIPENISRLALEKTSVRLNPTGSVLIAMYGATIGKVGILTFPATTNQACCACLPIEIYNEYVFYFLMSQKVAFVKQGEGGAQPNISKEKIVATLMPLPPLAEQYRIVAKIKEALPYVERYGEACSTANSLNAAFPNLLKKSILQEAVQGKLVPQDPADEPASVLLECIRAEKEQLIKAGKIKRDKHESVIFRRDNSHYEKLDRMEYCIDDEVAFDIPDTWEWVRFGQLYSLTNGTASRGSKDGTNRPVLKLANLSDNTIDISNVRNICLTDKDFLSHTIQMDDLIFIRVNGSKDRVASAFHYTYHEVISFCDHLFCGHKCSPLINADYIMFIFNCPSTRKQLIPEIKTTAGQNTISQASMAKILLPLPPLSEQARIVDEVFRIITRIDHL